VREDCIKYFDKISDYLDGELDSRTRAEIERHLLECPVCRDCVESLRKTLKLLKSSPNEPVPQDVKSRIRSALKDCIRGSSSPQH
jgi:anti-sigma factor (TIGR02949 family)